MKKILQLAKIFFIGLIIFSSVFLTQSVIAQEIPTPESHFGFNPGTDRMLFNYEPLIDYFRKLDDASDKIKMFEIGESPLGKKMYAAFISSPENIKNLERLKEINKTLALDHELEKAEKEKLIEEGKVFIMFTLSMHSTEVAPSQASPAIAYELVSDPENNYSKTLEDVVYMVIPQHNPDGMDMIVNHYNKYKGTKYEGSSMPGLYHKYVGHDNNRDFVTLSQSDNKAVADQYNKIWFPQVMVEKHQMGSSGPRYFVSPPHDPIAENIDAGLWNWIKIFGSNTITKMTDDGLKGVSHSYLFDDYWPGATQTCIWKGVIGMLTELASIKTATPIYIEPNELGAYGKGMGEYAKGINMPDPWEGGWWRFSDMIEYEKSSTFAYLETAAKFKPEILRFRNDIAKREVEKGKSEAPYYYIMPRKQHDQSELADLVNLLNEHGVNIFELTKNVKYDNRIYKAGDIIIPLAQPYRAFIKEVMENQVFPERHYTPGGEMIRPYDITSWSLPLHRGVEAIEVDEIFKKEDIFKTIDLPFDLKTNASPDKYALLTVNNNSSYKAIFALQSKGIKVERIIEDLSFENQIIPKGSFIVKTNSSVNEILSGLSTTPFFYNEKPEVQVEELGLPRIALIESWFHDMDAGWTRYVFDTYNIPFTLIRPSELENVNLEKDFDVLILPDEDKDVLMEGKYKRNGTYYTPQYPPEYTKGFGKKGLEKILKFVSSGGKVISWRNSTNLFIGAHSISISEEEKENFTLPIRNIGDELGKKGLYVTGSLLKIKLKPDHPLTYGLKEEIGVFHRGNPIFKTSQPYFDMDRRVIATFPKEDILMSGYGKHLELLEEQSAMVWIKKGKGQLILYSFNPQFRASTPGTYKLLFNAILL